MNSALQRARAQLAAAGLDEDAVTEPTDAGQRALLDRHARAIEQKDVTALVDMFTAEARWEMPPSLAWYRGPQDIARLVAVQSGRSSTAPSSRSSACRTGFPPAGSELR